MKIEKSVFSFFALALFALVATRAVLNPFVLDECTTFIEFVFSGHVFPFQGRWTTNNHYLNTALVWVCYKIFGINEWSLRLPNVLGFAVYLYAAYKIGFDLLKSTLLRWLFFLSLFSSYYILEFFGYARGYGLSFAFLLLALFYQIRTFQIPQKGDHIKSFMFMVLAIYSNLGLQFIYLMWMAVAFLQHYFQNKSILQKTVFYAIRLAPIGLSIYLSFILKNHGRLDVGHNGSLWFTFKSFAHAVSFNFQDYTVFIYNAILILFLFAGLFYLLKTPFKNFDGTLLFWIYFFGNLLFLILNHVVLDILYPVERTTLFWFVLLIPGLFLLLNSLSRKLNVVALLILPLLVTNGLGFAKSFSLNHSGVKHWQQEQFSDQFYHAIQTHVTEGYTLACEHLQHRMVIFKNLKFNGSVPFAQNTFSGLHDFVIQHPTNKNNYEDYHLVYTDAISGNRLLKRNSPALRFLIDQKAKYLTAATHIPVMEMPVENYRGSSLLFSTQIKLINTKHHPPFYNLILVLYSVEGKWLYHKKVFLHPFDQRLKNEEMISVNLNVEQIPANAKKVDIYIENKYKEKVTARTNCRVYKYN